MAYIALKPCCFADVEFKIGDDVPEQLLQPGAIPALIKMGKIADTNAEPVKIVPVQAPATSEPSKTPIEIVEIVVHAEEGDMPLEVTKEGLQAIFDVMSATVDDAEPIINEMTDGDALILLDISDNRKTIQAAAEARAKALAEEADEDEDENKDE